jgi:hypothetical protein
VGGGFPHGGQSPHSDSVWARSARVSLLMRNLCDELTSCHPEEERTGPADEEDESSSDCVPPLDKHFDDWLNI